MAAPHSFSYAQAFDRNIGWFTEWEQAALRAKCVAIAGMGGVGGAHLLSLVRLGIGAFRIADFDQFDLVNFNRQVGATLRSLGRPKVDVLAEMALDINPELRITRFPDGVTPDAIDAFLDGADLFIDGLDFFVVDIRRAVFARCAELGIPAITAAPIGMGAGLVSFVPGGMSFEQYFRLEGQDENEQLLRFLMGMAPAGLHRAYLVDPSRVDLPGRKGPSTIAACQLCAGMVTVAAAKLLLGRGDVKPAPFHHHFDPYLGRYVVTRLRGGNAGPLQQVRLRFARRAYAAMAGRAGSATTPTEPGSPLMRILDAARWAPSGDNAQPWRFQPVSDDTVLVHLPPPDADNVYEYRGGEPSLLSAGMLLESMRLAATDHSRDMNWEIVGQDPVQIRARFTPSDAMVPDPLYRLLMQRSVDRRPYRTRALTETEKGALEQALGPNLRVVWHENARARLQFARLGARATDIRLRAPETFAVHQRVLDWDHTQSPTGLPVGAVGLNPPTLRLMRWAMQDWRRMDRLNRMTGTGAAVAQLDYVPGIRSAAFFSVKWAVRNPDRRIATLLEAGQNLQRFWLTATKLRLAVQPGLAPLMFAQYGADGTVFTADAALRTKAASLSRSFNEVLGAGANEILFLGRIGHPLTTAQRARSTRRPLAELLVAGNMEPVLAS